MSNLLAKRALLVTLSTGAWRATKLHHAETAKVNADHNAKDIAKVSVKLSDHPALSKLGKLHAEARAEHYRVTLPSADDGFRLLPCGREMEHAATMARFSEQHESLVREFLAAYDAERASAPLRLNGLYDARHWPADVSGKFKFATRYLPVPDAGTWQEWLAESAEAGKEDLKARLAAAVRAMADKLGDSKAIFRDSLVENLREIVSLSGDLNLADDPVIAQLAIEASALTVHAPDALRNNPGDRSAAHKRAADICRNFNL